MYFNFMDQDQKEEFSFFHDALDSTVSHQQDDSEVTSSKRKGWKEIQSCKIENSEVTISLKTRIAIHLKENIPYAMQCSAKTGGYSVYSCISCNSESDCSSRLKFQLSACADSDLKCLVISSTGSHNLGENETQPAPGGP